MALVEAGRRGNVTHHHRMALHHLAGECCQRITEWVVAGYTNGQSRRRVGERLGRPFHEDVYKRQVLATAAYNAGPSKVAQWLPARAPVPADIWAETIPYQETRNYVQRVLEYAVIYTQRLGLPQADRPLGSRMKPVLAIEPAPGSSG